LSLFINWFDESGLKYGESSGGKGGKIIFGLGLGFAVFLMIFGLMAMWINMD